MINPRNRVELHPHLAVAVAGELRDEAHVIFADLNHLLADVVLRAAGDGRARPPGGTGKSVRERQQNREKKKKNRLRRDKRGQLGGRGY